MDPQPPFPPEIWERTPAEAQQDIRALDARVAVLEAMVQRLPAALQQVTERRQQDSRPSSRPPSSDPPQATGKRPRREPRGRRPGGQPGHEGHARAWLPVEAVDGVIPVKPERCSQCEQPLQGDDPAPQRQQVPEIPPVQPSVTESQVQGLVCPGCGAVIRAAMPPGVSSGGFGPRVQAITAVCTGADHLSKRATQHLLEDLFGLPLSLGTMANVAQATVQAVAAAVAEARASSPPQPAAARDETGWREGQQRAWLWTAATTWGTVFVVRRSRRGKVAQALLGERFWGWLITARWSGYRWYPTWRRQRWWAHVLRDIAAMIVRGGQSQVMGAALRTQARQMFHWWHRGRDGTLAQASFASSMRPIRQAVERWLEAGQTCGVPKTAGVGREILKRRQAWWTFGRHPGVEPTHHTAERAIRPGVLWRQGRCGTHSADGSRFVEALMTVVATRKQQHRHVLDDLTAACEAAPRGEPAPSLLPTPDTLRELVYPAA
jgi:transposase